MKFSRTAAAGLTCITALSLTACHPPHQKDSDVKTVDNASTYTGKVALAPESSSAATAGDPAASSQAQAAESAQASAAASGTPQFVDCASQPDTEPVSINLNCVENSDQLINIKWQSWGKDTATGTGTRTQGAKTINDVSVVLSQPTQTAEGLAFSSIEVDGKRVSP